MAVASSRALHMTPHCVRCGNVLLHITFAVLTLFTCGLFFFPWIVWANTVREHKVTLHVDAHGNITRGG